MPEARVRIPFPEATQEAFEVFADEAATQLPEVEVTYHDKPIMAEPYILVEHASKTSPWESWTLIVDPGDELCVAENNHTWVEEF